MENTQKKGRRKSSELTRSLDQHIGERIRLRRTLLGMSQTDFGAKLGLSFQQIQKYERGTSRIGAGSLWNAAEALDVPVSFFFDGLSDKPPTVADISLSQSELQMIRRFRDLTPDVREALNTLIAAAARGLGSPAPRREVREAEGREVEAAPSALAMSERAETFERSEPFEMNESFEARTIEPAQPRVRGAGSRRSSTKSTKRRSRGAVWDPSDIGGR